MSNHKGGQVLSDEYKLQRKLERIDREGRLGKARFVDRDGYIMVRDRLLGKTVRLHRYFWEFYNGPIPEGYDVHHKNENKKCNCIANLFLAQHGAEHQALHDVSGNVTNIWKTRSREERLRITKNGREASNCDIEVMRARAAHMRTFIGKKKEN